MPVLQQHMDHLLAVFSYVLDDTREDQLGSETKSQLIALVGHLNTQVEGVAPKIQAAGLARYL